MGSQEEGWINQASTQKGWIRKCKTGGRSPAVTCTNLPEESGGEGQGKTKKGGPLEACSTRPRLGAAPLRTNVSERNVRAMHNKAMLKQCGGTEEKE